MARIRLTKLFSFEMAHSLTGYDGSCKEIHGHSYKLSITVTGEPEDDPDNPKYGMTLDFGIIKKVVNEGIIERFDHSLVIRKTKKDAELIETLKKRFSKIEVVDYQPTCENLVTYFAEIVKKQLPEKVSLVSVKLCETATSYAEWYATDNE